MGEEIPSGTTLRAGAAAVDITPALGIHLGGGIGRYRPARGVDVPLYARALVLEEGGRRTCWLSLDLALVMREWSDIIRRQVAKSIGTHPDAVLVHATQTHAAPIVGYEQISAKCPLVPEGMDWLRGGDTRYHDFALHGIGEAAAQAAADLRPVVVGTSRAIDGRVAFNRRYVMRDGSVRTHPRRGDPDICYAEGPIDPEVGVLSFTSSEQDWMGMVLSYTCHPCHGGPYDNVNADWPSVWAEMVKAKLGDRARALVLNGCCGNIHHNNPLDPNGENDLQHMASCLTESTVSALHDVHYASDATLDWRTSHIEIPRRKLKPERLAWAQAILDEHPEPDFVDAERTRVSWDWVYAVSLLDMESRTRDTPYFDYELQAFRVADAAVVGLPGELFVEAQLEIKLASPAALTIVAHDCNDVAGYIPTRRALAGGGYETRIANWSCLAPEALEMIVEATNGLLRELFAGRERPESARRDDASLTQFERFARGH